MTHQSLQGRVLLVDDSLEGESAFDLSLIAETGLEMVETLPGTPVLDLAAELAPDVIVMNHGKARGNLSELCGVLQSDPDTAAIPLIVMIEDGDATPRRFDQGLVDLVRKPVDREVLEQRLRLALQYRHRLTELEDTVREAREMETWRDCLLASVAHDLKMHVTGMGQLLENQSEEADVLVDQALGLTDSLIELQQWQEKGWPIDQGPGDVKRSLQEAVQALGLTNMHDKWKTQLEEGLPLVGMGTPTLRRVMMNLLHKVQTLHTPGAATVITAESTDSGYVCVRVMIEGAGIAHVRDQETLRQLGNLDHFIPDIGKIDFRLAHCFLAVQAHGGEFSLETVCGEGHSFALTIPPHMPVEAPNLIPFRLPSEISLNHGLSALTHASESK